VANGDASSAVVQAEQVVVDVVGCAHLDQLEGLAEVQWVGAPLDLRSTATTQTKKR